MFSFIFLFYVHHILFSELFSSVKILDSLDGFAVNSCHVGQSALNIFIRLYAIDKAGRRKFWRSCLIYHGT